MNRQNKKLSPEREVRPDSAWVYATKKMPVRGHSTNPQKVGSETRLQTSVLTSEPRRRSVTFCENEGMKAADGLFFCRKPKNKPEQSELCSDMAMPHEKDISGFSGWELNSCKGYYSFLFSVYFNFFNSLSAHLFSISYPLSLFQAMISFKASSACSGKLFSI